MNLTNLGSIIVPPSLTRMANHFPNSRIPLIAPNESCDAHVSMEIETYGFICEPEDLEPRVQPSSCTVPTTNKLFLLVTSF